MNIDQTARAAHAAGRITDAHHRIAHAYRDTTDRLCALDITGKTPTAAQTHGVEAVRAAWTVAVKYPDLVADPDGILADLTDDDETFVRAVDLLAEQSAALVEYARAAVAPWGVEVGVLGAAWSPSLLPVPQGRPVFDPEAPRGDTTAGVVGAEAIAATMTRPRNLIARACHDVAGMARVHAEQGEALSPVEREAVEVAGAARALSVAQEGLVGAVRDLAWSPVSQWLAVWVLAEQGRWLLDVVRVAGGVWGVGVRER